MMYAAVVRVAFSFVTFCLMLCVLGCGSSGEDTFATDPVDLSGVWARHAVVDSDECGLADSLAVTSSVMTIGQDGGSLFVQTKGASDDYPVCDGSGSINGSSLEIDYDFQWQKRYSATAVCALSVQQHDAALASAESIEGTTALTVTMSGGDCPLIGERCLIQASFSASR
jgi:hypothetical protein